MKNQAAAMDVSRTQRSSGRPTQLPQDLDGGPNVDRRASQAFDLPQQLGPFFRRFSFHEPFVIVAQRDEDPDRLPGLLEQNRLPVTLQVSDDLAQGLPQLQSIDALHDSELYT